MSVGQFLTYPLLALISLVNIIIPISGSSVVTPFLAILTDAHTAIALASFYFFLSAIVRVFIFKKEIKWAYVKSILALSFIGAVIGAFALVKISPLILLMIILLFSIYFFYKKINEYKKAKRKKSPNRFAIHAIGFLSGFLQGTGLAGSDLRNSYLYSEGLTISQVHGTTAVIGAVNFFVATIIRIITNQIAIPNLIPLFYILPFIIIGSLAGKKILYKINKKYTDWIIILIMIVVMLFLAVKIINLF